MGFDHFRLMLRSTHYDYLHELPTTTLKVAVDAIDFEQLIDLSKFERRIALDLLLARKAKREVEPRRCTKRLNDQRWYGHQGPRQWTQLNAFWCAWRATSRRHSNAHLLERPKQSTAQPKSNA
jgi:hypothetical protein